MARSTTGITRAAGLLLTGILCLTLSGCQKMQTASETERSVRLSESESAAESGAKSTEGAERQVGAASEQNETEKQNGTESTEGTERQAGAASEQSEIEKRNGAETAQNEAVAEGESGPAKLSFTDMYSEGSSSRGLQFSEAFQSMNGKTVEISGYMAPPLKPVFNFFVLSKQPMAICPFCSTDADWPEDIVVVYVEKGAKSVANDTLLTITGRLELGSYTDEETGFVSQARIYADSIEHNR